MVASATSSGVVVFTALGQPGDLPDPNNWAGNVAPSAGSSVLFRVSATIQAPFTVHRLTATGRGTVMIENTSTTTSDNHYTSFEVNGGSVTVFTSSSTLQDAGGCLIGVDSSGTLVVQGNAASRNHPLFDRLVSGRAGAARASGRSSCAGAGHRRAELAVEHRGSSFAAARATCRQRVTECPWSRRSRSPRCVPGGIRAGYLQAVIFRGGTSQPDTRAEPAEITCTLRQG